LLSLSLGQLVSAPDIGTENIWQYLRQTYLANVYSRTTPPFSTRARTSGENFSRRPVASPQSLSVTRSSSINVFEGWHYVE